MTINWLWLPIEKLLKMNEQEGMYFPVNDGECRYIILGMTKKEEEFIAKLKAGKGKL